MFARWTGPRFPTLEERVQGLEERLFEALVELEALRAARLADPDPGARSRYQAAYRETSIASHNAAGPSGGLDKVVGTWEGRWPATLRGIVEGRGLRPEVLRPHEWAMLVRLGLNDDVIAAHAALAGEVEQYT